MTFVPGNGWTVGANNTVTQTIPTIAVGQSTTLTITFTIDADATGTITNFAEISEDNNDDCDSTADSNPNNDGTPVDNAVGTGCEPGGDEDDHDPESITLVGPSISVDKTDNNTLDQDGSTRNDTQTLNVGDSAVFEITVTNTGTEDLQDIVLTDVIAPNCGGSVTLPATSPATFLSFSHTGNNDAVFNPGETFTYTCDR